MKISNMHGILKAGHLTGDTIRMVGVHGIGKSDVAEQFAAREDFHIETLFASTQDVGDLIGNPITTVVNGEKVHKWSKPSWLHRMEQANKAGKHCMLFLDEMSRAQLDVRQALLPLTLSGKIHEHALPTLGGFKTLIVIADNPSDVKEGQMDYQVEELDPALADRLNTIEVEPDVNGWLDWAKDNKVNEIVRSFIIDNPDKLHWYNVDGEGSSPRSWTKLAKYIDIIDDIAPELHFPIFKGRVGPELGALFLSHMKNYTNVISNEDVITLVNKVHKTKIETTAKAVKELIEDQEVIRKTEMAYSFLDDIDNNEIPCLAVLYALEVEILNGVLKQTRSNKPDIYAKLTDLDDKINKKGLFIKLVEASGQM